MKVDSGSETIGPEQSTAATDADKSSVDDVASGNDANEELQDAPRTGDREVSAHSADHKSGPRRISWPRLVAFGVLPAVVLLLGVGASFLKWRVSSMRDADTARIESAEAARSSTIAMLSYRPDTVDQQLGAARNLLTGTFSDSYDALVHDVVIPGAKQRQISAVATVPAVASVSANSNRAVTLVFVNQTVIVGNSAPTNTASTVRVTLEKVGSRWLVSAFDPV